MVRRVHFALVLGVFAAMLFGGAAAQANDASVRAKILKETRLIKQSREIQSALRAASISPQSAPKLIHAFQSLELALAGAAAAVARTHASTAMGRKGRRDWITATRALAVGYGEFVAALKTVERGNKALAKRKLTTAAIAIRAAERIGARANRELHLA